MWRSNLDSIQSLGSQIRPGSLAGLAEARSKHNSQFFTSNEISSLIWAWLAPLMSRDDRYRSIIDNSVGSGRLLSCADPARHSIYGMDVDSNCIDALNDAAKNAGFEYGFYNTSMENCYISNFDFAINNPPFSITLDSPAMVALPCSTWGKFGKSKRANSTYYALEQSLLGASIVASLLPSSVTDYVLYKNANDDVVYCNRLAAIIRLPLDAFADEGISVDCSLFIFDSKPRNISPVILDFSVEPYDLGLSLPAPKRPRIERFGVAETKPLITLPVTGNKTVRVTHNNRWIHLKYECGLTQALVMNGVLNRLAVPVGGIRPAEHVKYESQGILDVEAWLFNGTAAEGLTMLCDKIRAAGGVPVVDSGLENYVAKRDRQSIIDNEPYRKWVFRKSGSSNLDSFIGTCHTNFLTDPDSWTSSIVPVGAEVLFKSVGDSYQYYFDGEARVITEDLLAKHFELKDKKSSDGEWQCLFEGRVIAFPDHADRILQKVKAAGVDKMVSWDYQLHDLLELLMASKGDVCSWEMGLGKARLALSLALMGGERNLICVEPYLVDELLSEIKAFNIPKDLYQIITTAEQTKELKKINIITYNRLRQKIKNSDGSRHKKKMLSHLIRRRIHTLVADEGSLMANEQTLQTKALKQVSPKKRYVLDGTPIQNYPRGIRPILNFTSGDSTARMPYGTYRYHICPTTIQSATTVGRGVDAFRERFVTLEWCTNQFAEDMTSGAKREVPKIADLQAYRALLNNQIKRRVQQEPEVKKFVNIDPPKRITTLLDFDDGHLAHYLKVADEFAETFKREKENASLTGKNINLTVLLARINAVRMACNQPQRKGKLGSWHGRTTKQDYVVSKAIEHAENGHKTIIYVDSPDTVGLLVSMIREQGVDAMAFHGGIPIDKRTSELNKRFRFGDCPILVATIHVTQKGLNLYQANRVIMYSRNWKATTEEQAIFRTCRPQQKREVICEYVMIEGSIDEYQAQMVDFKRDAANAGLDYAQPEYDDSEFIHLETIFEQFISDLAGLRGFKSSSAFRSMAKCA